MYGLDALLGSALASQQEAAQRQYNAYLSQSLEGLSAQRKAPPMNFPITKTKKAKTFREELQKEIDEWIGGN